ncbi:MAG: DUF4440 domain-containing protein [Ginsengibacter sp.]|jgi:hypothetical protein
MKKNISLFCVFLLLISFTSFSQSKDKITIRQILQTQETAWNKGNLTQFMKGYWPNDSLMFIGKSGITYGYQKTLDNYIKGYPDTASMGKLHFDILEMKNLAPNYYFVIGKWFLKRSIGDVGGHFTLLFRKINQKWFIVADHSS